MKIYFVDTFTRELFSGNPAAVCVLSAWLPEKKLQAIATELNQPVTVFILKENTDYEIRWFTPEYELELCGHGSLASAFVIFQELEPTLNEIKFTRLKQEFLVKRQNNLIELNFPAKQLEPTSASITLLDGLGHIPEEIYQEHTERLVAVFADENLIRTMKPDMTILKKLGHRGVVVTAPAKSVDFVSRTFYPHKFVMEDAVTGASHCLLVPYWAKRLNKSKLHALQVSKRGGELFCEFLPPKVLITGAAVFFYKSKA